MRSKSYLIGLMIIAIFFNAFITLSYAELTNAYEIQYSERLSKGVVHGKILRLTDNGWVNMDVLRINLKDEYTSLDVLVSKEGISEKDSLTGFASKNESSSKIIGVINGDFYDTRADSTIGPIVRNGNLITSSKNCPEFATFNINKKGTPSIDYWKNNTLKLINTKNNYVLDIKYKNKSYVDRNIILLDKAWGDFSFGKKIHDNIVEMVIVDNKVKEIRNNLEAIEIPKDGYIVAATDLEKEFILNNFSIDDKVSLEVESDPSFENLDLSIGGGAVILRDGNIPSTFSLEVRGRYARTALGITKDKSEIIILTISKKSPYIGVKQKELAKILLELGAYNGINLDGGISTGMLIRNIGESDLTLVGGRNRRVMNGLAVLNTSPKSDLKKILIDCKDKNIALGSSMAFTVKGYDENYNPVEINLAKAKWKVQGVNGEFIKNKFVPKTTGQGTVTVTYEGKTASIDIKVLAE
ncbi:phosphodiester glycosidase family protein [Wukongibacter baidiensis]|uniref:phosphodiester glycosidase family protein n=1 Tax=Wukongibacter baidiensis TaxID=1723361 RepID=UPI003D7F5947